MTNTPSFMFKPPNEDGLGELIMQFPCSVIVNLSFSPGGRDVVFRYQQNNPFPYHPLAQRNVAVQFELPVEQFMLLLKQSISLVDPALAKFYEFGRIQVNQTWFQICCDDKQTAAVFMFYPGKFWEDVYSVSIPYGELIKGIGLDTAVDLVLQGSYATDPDRLLAQLAWLKGRELGLPKEGTGHVQEDKTI